MADRKRLGARIVGAVAAVVVAALGANLSGLNSSAAGFVLLIAVLFVATWGGLAAGIAASFAASSSYTFFLPPLASVHVRDPENWIALAAFLTTAILASRLVTRAREQAERAEQRAREVAAVHAFTVEIMAAAHELPVLAGLAGEALVAAGARGAGLLVADGRFARPIGWRGEPCTPDTLELAATLGDHEETLSGSEPGERDHFLPVRSAGSRLGVLTSLGTRANAGVVQAVSRVLHLAVERERLLAEQAHLEVLRESESMKTAILRAVSHDLSTPLTAIRFQVDALRRLVPEGEARANLDDLESETSRLTRRIEDLLALARLEAGAVRPHPEPVPPADLFRAARESLPMLRRPIVVKIDPDCPEALADPALALEIVVNLLENAHRASPESAPIELVASATDSGGVRLGVLDRGRGIEGRSPGRVIGTDELPSGGLGLEIARRFTAANAGRLALEPRAGGGIAAWLELPAAETVSLP